MTGSLNELEILVKRATRGAGWSWGIAEEAGKSARWLASRGFPAGRLVLAWLQHGEGIPYRERIPADPRSSRWAAGSGFLCPVCTGCALSDRGTGTPPVFPLHLVAVATPLLLVPFLERLARALRQPVCLEGEGIRWVLDGADGWQAEAGTGLQAATADLILQPVPESPPPRVERFYRVDWAPDDKSGLESFAHRIFAPASIGHQSGAGAGLRDND